MRRWLILLLLIGLAVLLLRDDRVVFRNRYSQDARGLSWSLVKFLAQMRSTPFQVVDLPRAKPDVAWLKANRSTPTLTWIGHASFLVQIGGFNVLTDPHLTARASPLPFGDPKRLNPPGLDFHELPEIHAVLISHNHYDHLDLPTVRRLAAEHSPQFFVPLGLKAWFAAEGMNRVIELNWWQSAALRELSVTAVPVQHFSGRTATDRNKTLWTGFVLELAGRKLFFAGDTGYSRDFADIAERFAPLDLALIPIGAYEPRDFMRVAHVNPEEAVRIHQDLRSRQSVAMHWGTFRLTLEAMDDPPNRLAAALDQARVPREQFWVLKHGETRKLFQP